MVAPEKPIRFRFWCQKVLPAVYDDSLSYYETICKIADALDKCIDYLDYLDKEIITWDELNPKLDALQGQIDTINGTLREHKSDIDSLYSEIARLDTRITDELQEMRKWVLTQIELKLASLEMYLKMYADEGDKHVLVIMKTEIDKIYKVIDQIPKMEQELFNPTKGYLDDASDTVGDVYEFLRYLGMTALEFQVLCKTAAELDSETKTTRWEDTASRLLHDYCLWKNSFDPTTGAIRSNQNVMLSLFQMFGTGDNVESFEGFSQDATTLDSYDRTADDLGLYSVFFHDATPYNRGVSPFMHSDTSTKYGAATTTFYGHAKLTNAINSTEEGLACTPKAVYDFVKAELSAAGL